MSIKNYLNSPGAFPRPKKRAGAFKEFDATELYCPRCQRSVPVRKRLLLVLPEGDKYDYRCAFCSESVGSKIDRKQKPLTIIG